MRHSGRVVALLLSLFVGLSVMSPSQGAQPPRGPDAWSGLAFDTCSAPSQRAMDRWRRSSPYVGVGVYIGGRMRACAQKNLTHRWVETQIRHGWKLLPIWVGPQAPCTSYGSRISSARGARGMFPVARSQGMSEAKRAAASARRLGLERGATLWYDLEYFRASNKRCARASLRFLSAWTRGVHRAGYVSGVYSSVSAAINVLDTASRRGRRAHLIPDRVWFAWANGRPDTHIDRDWVRSARWKRHARVHQYRLDHRARYGGVRMSIDSNYVRLGGRPAGAGQPAGCGTAASRRSYPKLRPGTRGRTVRVVRCLLEKEQLLQPFGKQLRTDVRQFQRRHDLDATGRVGRSTWVALLTDGSRRLVKRGTTGPAVRRLQRSLNAALDRGPRINGHFGLGTAQAVKRYQSRLGHRRTGVVTKRTWRALAHGRLHRSHKR